MKVVIGLANADLLQMQGLRGSRR